MGGLCHPYKNLFPGGGKVDLSIVPSKGGFNFADSFKMPDVSQGLTGKALQGLQKQNQAILVFYPFHQLI